ncbi:MAG: tetratricopeptide repeat protein [Pseudomonadales bacterium]
MIVSFLAQAQLEIAPIVSGQDEEEPTESIYKFKESPVNALKVLEQLQSEFDVKVSDDERSLFDDASDGRLDSWSLAEAALLASGVDDRGERERYLTQLAQLSTSAKRAMKEGSEQAIGEQLLHWIHERPLRSGYVAEQSLLSTVLDKGTYNCVSSAVFYTLLGSELGLDVRGVEVPDHAFAKVFIAGKGIDVETTTEYGYHPARSRVAAAKFAERTGFAYIPVSRSHLRRETSLLGLIALIYYNRGVEFSDREEHFTALLYYFRALSLDKEAASAIKNALASISNLGLRLANTKDFEGGLRVLDAGLSLAPDDRSLRHNKKALWQMQINDTKDTASREELIAMIRKADAAMPKARFSQQLVHTMIQPAEQLAKSGNWAESVKEYANVRKEFPNNSILKQNEVATWHQWANHYLEKKNWAEALNVYEKALQQRPTTSSYQQNIAFASQQMLSELSLPNPATKAASEALLAQFPGSRKLQDSVSNRYRREISNLIDSRKFESATALAKELATLINKPSVTRKPIRFAYDAWGHELLEGGQFERATAVYAESLQALPGDSHLKSNAIATWHAWAKPHLNKRGCEQAIDIYERGLQAIPNTGLFKQNIKYCMQQLAQ